MLRRSAPCRRRTPPKARKPMRQVSERRVEADRAAGYVRTSTLPAGRPTKTTAPGRPAPARVDTGPDSVTVDVVLDLHQHSCALCAHGLGSRRGVDYSIHHRVLRAQGVDNSFPNLIPLCGGSGWAGCHQLVHSRPKWARDFGGWLLKGSDDPAAFPVLVERGSRWALLTADGRAVTTSAPVGWAA